MDSEEESMPGPVPKRSSDRVRRNKPDVPLKIGQAQPVNRPPEDRAWHVVAKRLYRSLKTSGQTTFWQDSDWEYARFLMDQISRMLNTSGEKPLRAGQLAEVNRMMGELMMTEPARRRARVELQHASGDTNDDHLGSVTSLADFQGVL